MSRNRTPEDIMPNTDEIRALEVDGGLYTTPDGRRVEIVTPQLEGGQLATWHRTFSSDVAVRVIDANHLEVPRDDRGRPAALFAHRGVLLEVTATRHPIYRRGERHTARPQDVTPR